MPMSRHSELFDAAETQLFSRRGLLGNSFFALAGVGLVDLMGREASAAPAPKGLVRGRTHFAPKAKRVLQIFCPGAASQIDLWEHKPELEKRHGQPLPGEGNFF